MEVFIYCKGAVYCGLFRFGSFVVDDNTEGRSEKRENPRNKEHSHDIIIIGFDRVIVVGWWLERTCGQLSVERMKDDFCRFIYFSACSGPILQLPINAN